MTFLARRRRNCGVSDLPQAKLWRFRLAAGEFLAFLARRRRNFGVSGPPQANFWRFWPAADEIMSFVGHRTAVTAVKIFSFMARPRRNVGVSGLLAIYRAYVHLCAIFSLDDFLFGLD